MKKLPEGPWESAAIAALLASDWPLSARQGREADAGGGSALPRHFSRLGPLLSDQIRPDNNDPNLANSARVVDLLANAHLREATFNS